MDSLYPGGPLTSRVHTSVHEREGNLEGQLDLVPPGVGWPYRERGEAESILTEHCFVMEIGRRNQVSNDHGEEAHRCQPDAA